MKKARTRLAEVGERISPNLTVLGIVDGGAKEPVYIVWNSESWCPMACKVFPSLHRAREEADTLSQMSHPYIVRSLGVENPGCLLMPFLEGQALGDMLDAAPKNRLTLSNALRIAIHVGAALSHVHAKGYLHMDVKPNNVMIAPGGRPVLFDFGSARRIGDPRPKTIIGTNAYVAPEECALSEAGTPADVFSLAVMLYEMLTGELPFGRGTKVAPFPQIKGDIKPIRKLRKDIPEALENLIFACLERNPDFRPTLVEIIPALNGFITTGPTMWPSEFDPISGRYRSHSQRLPRHASTGGTRYQGSVTREGSETCGDSAGEIRYLN